jgi:hypothetical protein
MGGFRSHQGYLELKSRLVALSSVTQFELRNQGGPQPLALPTAEIWGASTEPPGSPGGGPAPSTEPRSGAGVRRVKARAGSPR